MKECHSIGEEALHAHMNLYIHPSGSLYAVHLIDLDQVEEFIKKKFTDNLSFITHIMFRLELAFKGDFEIITSTIWQYTDTLRATEISANILKNSESPYAPRLVLRRFVAEMEWALNVAPENTVMGIYKWLSSTYLHYATWNFKDINDNSSMHEHYNSYKIKSSINEERENFKRIANSFSEEKINDVDLMNEYRNYINKIIL